MSEEQLNEQYIRDNIQGICQDCIYLNKIVPIIREMLSETYINGLEQGKFDRQMLELENQKYKEVIDKLNNLNNRIIEEYKLNYGDNPSKLLLALNTISDILKEVE